MLLKRRPFILPIILILSLTFATAIDVTSCQSLNQENAVYELKNDVTSETSTCFTIEANSITLDGKGFSVAGKITNTGFNSTIIRNLNLESTLRLEESNNNIIEDNTISGGILIYAGKSDSRNNIIRNNILSGSSATQQKAILLVGSSLNTIEDNTITGQVHVWSNDNMIKENEITVSGSGTPPYPFVLDYGSENNKVMNNQISLDVGCSQDLGFL